MTGTSRGGFSTRVFRAISVIIGLWSCSSTLSRTGSFAAACCEAISNSLSPTNDEVSTPATPKIALSWAKLRSLVGGGGGAEDPPRGRPLPRDPEGLPRRAIECQQSSQPGSILILTSRITWWNLLADWFEKAAQHVVDLVMGLRSFQKGRLGRAISTICSAWFQVHGRKRNV